MLTYQLAGLNSHMGVFACCIKPMACLTPNWPISLQIYAGLTILGTLRLRGLYPIVIPHCSLHIPLYSQEESKQEWMGCLMQMITESTGSPDQSVAPSTYEEDDDLYASIEEVRQEIKNTL